MSVLQTPATIYVRPIDITEDGVLVGRFKTNINTELSHITLNMCFFSSALSPFSTDSIRLKVLTSKRHSSISSASSYAQSDDVPVTTATTQNKWYGWVRFDFDNQNLQKDSYYYLYLLAQNYTRVADTRFISYVLDNVAPVYMDETQTDLNKYSGQFIVYMYK